MESLWGSLLAFITFSIDIQKISLDFQPLVTGKLFLCHFCIIKTIFDINLEIFCIKG